jgi:hypothetical protein
MENPVKMKSVDGREFTAFDNRMDGSTIAIKSGKQVFIVSISEMITRLLELRKTG